MSRRLNRQLNHKGYSLIELIVVIAIMMTLMGLMAMGIGMLGKGNSKKCSKMIVSALTEVKNNTLSMDDTWLAKIYVSDNQYVVDVIKDGESQPDSTYKLGSRITVAYKDVASLTDTSIPTTIGSSDTLTIRFHKRTGIVESVYLNGSLCSNNTIGMIVVSAHGGTDVHKLALYYQTGKLETDY